MLSQTGGVKFEISFISHAGGAETEVERTEVKLQRTQSAAERKHCSTSGCAEQGAAAVRSDK